MQEELKKQCILFEDVLGVKADGTIVNISRTNIVWCDMNKKTLMKAITRRTQRCKWTTVDLSGIEPNRVLDLSDEGDRWEGDIMDGKPFGWGVLYDGDDNVVYEGFRVGDGNVCIGRSYYPDIHKVQYEGELCNGKRWGRGTQYDRNGSVVYEGEWLDDAPIETRCEIDEDNQLLHSRVEVLNVRQNKCSDSYQWRVFDVSMLVSLRELTVGTDCYETVRVMKLMGMHELEKVVVENYCFRGTNPDNGDRSEKPQFYVNNCEKLRELRIGCRSFSDYTVCAIENVPSLEVIQIGNMEESSGNFSGAKEFVLRSIGKGKEVMIRFAKAEIAFIWRPILRGMPLRRV